MSKTTGKNQSGTSERVRVGINDVMAQGTIEPATKLFAKDKPTAETPARGGRHTMMYVRSGEAPPPWTPPTPTPATERTTGPTTAPEAASAGESQPVATLDILGDEEELAQRAVQAFGG